jgi:riboflavin biosynthesis pyrimidine reductase
VRQIYPEPADLAADGLAARYAYPDLASPGPPGRGQWWLRANMITSLDGAATVRGRSGGLSGGADREVFALLRALADVILVGAGTAREERYGPVRPGEEGVRWAWLRDGRTPAPPIAVVTRQLSLDPASPLLAAAGAAARAIVITTEAAPAGLRASVGRTAEVIVAGQDRVDLPAAVAALASRGYRRLLTEGGPQLLAQLIDADLVDELCLTISPRVAGPGAGRIVQGSGPLAGGGRPFDLAHVLAQDGHLLCRYARSADGVLRTTTSVAASQAHRIQRPGRGSPASARPRPRGA